MRKGGNNAMKMEMCAERAGYLEMGTARDMARDVTHGCDLGTRGVNLCPSTSLNASVLGSAV